MQGPQASIITLSSAEQATVACLSIDPGGQQGAQDHKEEAEG